MQGYKKIMTTKIKWRLSKLPTPSELVELVNNKLVTQDEAKEILFTQEEAPDVEDLKKEIEFLRKVVEDLSKSKTDKVTVIEKHIKNYPDYHWHQPYYTYCSTWLTTDGTTINGGGGVTTLTGTANSNASVSLTDLKTF